MDNLMTVEEVAKLLRKSPRWVREYCRPGKPANQRLPHAKIGNEPFFIRESLIEWIKSKESVPGAA